MIRIIAMLTMLMDHVGYVFFPNMIIFPVVGRLAFPLFAWGIAEGYKRTGSFKIYALRLLILAVVSQYPYLLLFKVEYFNVCFTLLAGLMVLRVYNTKMNLLARGVIMLLIGIAVHVLDFEYGIYGIAIIFLFHIFDKKYQFLIPLQIAAVLIGMKLYRFDALQLFSIASVGAVAVFEKYNFKISKIITYSFYPAHILIFLLIKTIYK